mmetsp:Transcript_1785/g.3258  ORF Transcript_1785/g.3258 Transcript_1785/m.3258 type:complete len:346 (-) Transcript_1785:144-1181(-)
MVFDGPQSTQFSCRVVSTTFVSPSTVSSASSRLIFLGSGHLQKRCGPRCRTVASSVPTWNVAWTTLPEVELHPYSADLCFILEEEQLLGIVDCGAVDASDHGQEPQALRERFEIKGVLVDAIVQRHWEWQENVSRDCDDETGAAVEDNDDLVDPESPGETSTMKKNRRDHYETLRQVMLPAFDIVGSKDLASAIVMRLNGSLLEVVWIGTCGFLIVRGSEVSESSSEPSQRILERSLGVTLSPRLSLKEKFRFRRIIVHPGDLVVAGSDGFFNNVSQDQILALLRPTPSGAFDPTLSVANATCLATRTTDDPELQSYMMAHLALNFADYNPIPPDDISVIVASIL